MDRSRTACWYVLHLGLGGVVAGATLAVPPFAVLLLALPVVRPGPRSPYTLPTAGPALYLTPIAGLALLAALVGVAAGAGAVLARAAPVLLGPSPRERLERAERRAAELAVRNRLAREVHDSVGHALSAIALQATAARRLLDGPAGGAAPSRGRRCRRSRRRPGVPSANSTPCWACCARAAPIPAPPRRASPRGCPRCSTGPGRRGAGSRCAGRRCRACCRRRWTGRRTGSCRKGWPTR
ncbi:histidine kinase dimerization/phosphoacceptor domain-containing protein [Actinomadura keratinilytica]